MMSARSKKETMQCPDKSSDRRPINHLYNILTQTPKNKNSDYTYMDQIQTHAKCYWIRDVSFFLEIKDYTHYAENMLYYL